MTRLLTCMSLGVALIISTTGCSGGDQPAPTTQTQPPTETQSLTSPAPPPLPK